MYNSISNCANLLQEDGVYICAIDDFEVNELAQVTDIVFGREGRLGTLAIETKPSGRTNDNFLATCHEYYLCYSKNPDQTQITFLELSDDQKKQYSEEDVNSPYKWRDFLRTGGYSTPKERPNSFYPIYYDPKSNIISTQGFENAIAIYPIDSSRRERVWRKTIPSLDTHIQAGDILIN
jgi:adenine-specific DNA-methyltransferase